MAKITRERAERIARAHACSQCKEYNFKKISVKPASKSIKVELGAEWIAVKVCGVCGHLGELGLQDDGDIVFES